MQEIEKNIAEIKAELFSGNEDLVIDTIEYIRNLSVFQDIESLLDLYITSSSKEIKTAIYKLLSDIKDISFVDTFVSIITKPKYQSILNELVSICWQNSLDFSPHIDVFVDLLLKGNIQIAIECFTVIEESLVNLTDKKRLEIKEKLLSNISIIDNNRKGLIEELTHIL